MRRGNLALAVLVLPAALFLAAASTLASAATSTPAATPTPSPTPIIVTDPQCAFTNGCVTPTPAPQADPTPNAGVRGASVSTPATGGGFPPVLIAIPLIGLGLIAFVWARRRR